ncbi:MAG: 2,3-bisphosphoglycerate-independent phosphoglycerate mutase, partial [Acidobacteria bacterium]|nr:2,3-bisphosphoglycerate-independent phosphoglycerate mutase [Acidobacteriota bacterium]
MINRRGPLALIILDGWGYTPQREGNAIALAETPFYDEILEKYPHTLIEASGTCVGLPANVMGNSEVGHLNMGSGRVIMTDLRRIDHAVETGAFFSNDTIVAALDGALARGGAFHLMGLLSDGLVHSSQEHLYALLRMAKERGLSRVYVHCFLDGRDTPPMSAYGYVEALQVKCAEIGCGRIASVIGRYYAMDRDQRWERTRRAYDLLVHAVGERVIDPVEAVKRSYERGISDEFVEPLVVMRARETGEPVATIQDGDSVVFFNFRSDRARQITRALAVPDFEEFPAPDRPRLDYVGFTVYDKTFPFPAAFPQLAHKNILADVFA